MIHGFCNYVCKFKHFKKIQLAVIILLVKQCIWLFILMLLV